MKAKRWVALASIVGGACGPVSLDPGQSGAVGSAACAGVPCVTDFEGTYDRRAGNATIGAGATFAGSITVYELPVSTVATFLPADLELAPRRGAAPSASHPVLVIAGVQQDGFWITPFGHWPLFTTYDEAMVLVPFVRKVGGAKLHNFSTGMFLNNSLAASIGNTQFGYNKVEAAISNLAGTWVATDVATGVPLFANTTIRGFGSYEAIAGSTDAALLALLEMVELPVVGDLNGSFVCSYFEWYTDAASARAALGGALGLSTPLRSTMASKVPLAATTASGAYEVSDVTFALATTPLTCVW